MVMKIVQRNFHELNDDKVKKGKYSETIFKHFIQSFVNEYSLGLQENHSHSQNIKVSTACSLKVGDFCSSDILKKKKKKKKKIVA